MIVKIICGLIACNVIVLLGFITMYLASKEGRRVDAMESGWMTIFFSLGFITILLSAIPLYYGKSTFTLFWSGFFALLPLLIWIKMRVFKKN